MYYYSLLIVGVLCAHYLIKKKIYKVIMGGINVVMLIGAIQYDGLTPFIKWLSLLTGLVFLVGGVFFKNSIFRNLGYMMYIIMIYVAMRYYGVTTETETFFS